MGKMFRTPLCLIGCMVIMTSCNGSGSNELSEVVRSALHNRSIDTSAISVRVDDYSTYWVIKFEVPDSVSHGGWCHDLALHSMVSLYSSVDMDRLGLDSVIFEISNVLATDSSEYGPWRYLSARPGSIDNRAGLPCDYMILSKLFVSNLYSSEFFVLEEMMSDLIDDHEYISVDSYVGKLCKDDFSEDIVFIERMKQMSLEYDFMRIYEALDWISWYMTAELSPLDEGADE